MLSLTFDKDDYRVKTFDGANIWSSFRFSIDEM